MKRGGYLTRNVEKARAWLDKRSRLERKTPMKQVNRERKKRNFAKQYGDKAAMLRDRQKYCPVTGRSRGLHASHVGRTLIFGSRRADQGNRYLILLAPKVHDDYDNRNRALSDEEFQEKWGWTRREIDMLADFWHAEWEAERAA